MKVKEYPVYNKSDSGRSNEEKLEVVRFAQTLEKCCLKCAHFTQVSQIDNGKCHCHYTRHDVHDVCESFETKEAFVSRMFEKKKTQNLEEFLDVYKNQLPPFMVDVELLNYEKEGKLHEIVEDGEMIGFFVVDEEKMKSLFVREESRYLTPEILPGVYQFAKILSPGWLTIAADPNNPRTAKHALLNGFVKTDRTVQGKDRLLEIWEWRAQK